MATVRKKMPSAAHNRWISTARLSLVPYLASMVTPEHVSWLNDPETMKYSEQRHVRHTMESQHKYLNGFPAGSHIWLIKAGDKDIGTITAYVDEPNKLANMGILIAKEHQGQGAGREAWRAVMDFLKGIGMEKIECGMRADNAPMRDLARNVGMRYEGGRLKHLRDDAGHRWAIRHYAWFK